jgi:hypothetical protein
VSGGNTAEWLAVEFGIHDLYDWHGPLLITFAKIIAVAFLYSKNVRLATGNISSHWSLSIGAAARTFDI